MGMFWGIFVEWLSITTSHNTNYGVLGMKMEIDFSSMLQVGVGYLYDKFKQSGGALIADYALDGVRPRNCVPTFQALGGGDSLKSSS